MGSFSGRLVRYEFNQNNTFGVMEIFNGSQKIFSCDVVEDTVRTPYGTSYAEIKATEKQWKLPQASGNKSAGGDTAIPFSEPGKPYSCGLFGSNRFCTHHTVYIERKTGTTCDGSSTYEANRAAKPQREPKTYETDQYAPEVKRQKAKYGLEGVPCFSGIKFHRGTNEGYTEGCLILGRRSGKAQCFDLNVSIKTVVEFETLMEKYGNPTFPFEITKAGMEKSVGRTFSGIKLGDYLFREQMICYGENGHNCGKKIVDYVLVSAFDQLAKKYGDKFDIASGTRCVEMNKLCKGVQDSNHLIGKAIDFSHSEMKADKLIQEIQSTLKGAVSVLKIDDTIVHMDVRSPSDDKKKIPIGSFTRADYACKCGCGFDSVDYTVVRVLETIKQTLSRPIQILESQKCEQYAQNGAGMFADFSVPKSKKDNAMEASDIVNTFGGKFSTIAKLEKMSQFVVRVIAL